MSYSEEQVAYIVELANKHEPYEFFYEPFVVCGKICQDMKSKYEDSNVTDFIDPTNYISAIKDVINSDVEFDSLESYIECVYEQLYVDLGKHVSYIENSETLSKVVRICSIGCAVVLGFKFNIAYHKFLKEVKELIPYKNRFKYELTKEIVNDYSQYDMKFTSEDIDLCEMHMSLETLNNLMTEALQLHYELLSLTHGRYRLIDNNVIPDPEDESICKQAETYLTLERIKRKIDGFKYLSIEEPSLVRNRCIPFDPNMMSDGTNAAMYWVKMLHIDCPEWMRPTKNLDLVHSWFKKYFMFNDMPEWLEE